MKMTRKKIGLSAALVLGLAAGLLRAFGDLRDPGFTYYLLLLGGAGILMAYGWLLGTKPAPESRTASKGFRAAMAASAALLLVGAVLLLPRLTAAFDVITAAIVLLFFVSALGIVMSLKEEGGEVESVFVTLPVCAMSFFLVGLYREYVATEAVVHVYALEMLAASALTAALYAVSSMRFLNRSRSPLITGSVLTAVCWTLALLIGSLIGEGFIFGIAEYLLCLGSAVYAVAWFLEPPVKYAVPEKTEADDGDEDEIACEESADGEEEQHDLDDILKEFKDKE